MKVQPKIGSCTNIEHTVELLGRLLCKILDLFESHGCSEMSMSDIEVVARDLECGVSPKEVRNLLVAQGFLSETPWYLKLALTSDNLRAIKQFFIEHAKEFEGSYLGMHEWRFIFGDSQEEVSPEVLLVKIMGLFTEILHQFDLIQDLDMLEVQQEQQVDALTRAMFARIKLDDRLSRMLVLHAQSTAVREMCGELSPQHEKQISTVLALGEELAVWNEEVSACKKLCNHFTRGIRILNLLKQIRPEFIALLSRFSAEERKL